MLGVVTYQNVAKDIVKANVTIDAKNYCISLAGCYTLRESIWYEPASEFDIKVKYKGPYSTVPHAGIMSKFGIRTRRLGVDEVDVFSLNAGISYEIIKDLTLKLEVENILDQRYEIWEGYTEGGIQFFVSLKYKTMK
jgi:outer membrane receptor protein involved in Fe transport